MKLSGRTTCVISDRFKFKYLLIAKNATSTLRSEFGKAIYQSREAYYKDLDRECSQKYFTFTCLRHPVSRVVSVYHEISRRLEKGLLQQDGLEFLKVQNPEKRFEMFLQEIPALYPEPHVRRQVDYIDGIEIDYFVCFERLQPEMEVAFQILQLGDCPILPKLRSRQKFKDRYYAVYDKNIDESIRDQILDIYADDLILYNKMFNVS